MPELLSLLHGLRKTGVLFLLTESSELQFVVRGGGLLYGSSQGPKYRLGTYLRRFGALPDEEPPEPKGQDGQAQFGNFGQRQVELGRVSPEELRHAVKEQILDLLGLALAWRHGAFYFEETELPFGAPQDRTVSTQSALLEATRRADEKARLQAMVPNLEWVLHRTDQPTDALDSQPLRAVLALVDGQRTVEQVLQGCSLPTEEAATALNRCLEQGLLTVGDRLEVERDADGSTASCLPVSPSAPGRLLAISGSEEPQGPRIANLLASEPALAAKALSVLCLDNTPVPRAKLNLSLIVETLGAARLRAALIPQVLRALYFPRSQVFAKAFWEHSAVCARLCRQIALQVRFPFPEEAYLAGLLHNIGALALLSLRPVEYEQIVGESEKIQRDIDSLEQKSLGTSHSALGARLAEQWAFPPTLSQAIQWHAREAPGGGSPLLHIVNVALGALEEGRRLPVGYEGGLKVQFKASLAALNLQKAKILSLLGAPTRQKQVARV